MSSSQIEIYHGAGKDVVFDIDTNAETIWATEEQLSELFGVDRSVINRHIRNIYKDGELTEKATCAKNAQVRMEGARQVTREVRSFNLDMIISVGYRVNSRKATDFRIWATRVLKSYVVNGAAINEKRLKELDFGKLQEIESALGIVKRLMADNELSASEAGGILEVISKYAPSFKTLEEFDAGHISLLAKNPTAAKMLSEEECLKVIVSLKKTVKGDEAFGVPRGNSFTEMLTRLTNEFESSHASVANKAANLLYAIIKEHPFKDGNKRIAALLFVVFLTINRYHLAENGETKISDRALTALALLIAESNSAEKDLIVALVCKLLEN